MLEFMPLGLLGLERGFINGLGGGFVGVNGLGFVYSCSLAVKPLCSYNN